MANDEDLSLLRGSLVTIVNALTDRATLHRNLVEGLISGLVAKGVFTNDEIKTLTEKALEQREKQRAEYRIPDDESTAEKLGKLHKALSAEVVDLASIRDLLDRK